MNLAIVTLGLPRTMFRGGIPIPTSRRRKRAIRYNVAHMLAGGLQLVLHTNEFLGSSGEERI